MPRLTTSFDLTDTQTSGESRHSGRTTPDLPPGRRCTVLMVHWRWKPPQRAGIPIHLSAGGSAGAALRRRGASGRIPERVPAPNHLKDRGCLLPRSCGASSREWSRGLRGTTGEGDAGAFDSRDARVDRNPHFAELHLVSDGILEIPPAVQLRRPQGNRLRSFALVSVRIPDRRTRSTQILKGAR